MRSRTLHLEPTNRCQLSCPSCPRTEYPSHIVISDVDIELVTRSLDQYTDVYMCGNHGDSIYHPRFHELLIAIKEAKPDIRIQFETNGSGRTKTWWEKTAEILRPIDAVIFSVDGMRDNNHFYRIGSKWDSIEMGMRTLRENNAKVRMVWKWILFHHNQKAVGDGLALSKEIGFNRFNIVSSDRNDDDHWLTPTKNIKEIMEALNV